MTGTLSWGGNINSLNLRTGHDSYNGIITYRTAGNEALCFTTKNAVTSFLFYNGEDSITNSASDRWYSIIDGVQIKNNCMSIGSGWASGTTPDFKLKVGGVTNISGGINSQHGHIFNVGGNEFNWIPDGYNSSMWFNYETFNRANNGTINEYICGNGHHGQANLKASAVYGAVWNDIAETRKCKIKDAGNVVIETNTGEMILCNKRMAPGAKIISDTFGYLMGQINDENQAIAIAGRVLVKINCNKSKFKLGMAVCAGPNGGVVPMRWYEKIFFPERIIGTVSEIPTYDIWYGGKILADPNDEKIEPYEGKPIPVNGRIWIYVK